LGELLVVVRVLRERLTTIRPLSWLKITAALVVLAIAFNSSFFDMLRRGFDVRFLWAALTVQPLILLGLVVQSKRHILLVGEPKVPLSMAFKAMALSLGLNLLLPGRLSEVLKATYLRDHAGVPLSVGMSAVVLERTVDLLIVAALGSLGLALFIAGVDYKMVLIFGTVGATILLVAFFARDSMLRLARALPWLRLASFAEQAYLHFAATVRTVAFFKALALGVIGWGIAYANILVFLQLASSIPIGFSGALLVFVFTTIGGAVPVLPGGLGTYEVAGVLALRSLGYPFDEAIAVVIALHGTQLVMTFVLAVAVMLTERIGLSSLIADLRAAVASPRI
jgi:uncharacterized membrane protein YbhN (UPF0104 family)